MENLLLVGILTSTHGVRGEVKVFPTTDDSKRFTKLKEVILDTGIDKRTLSIEGVKFFKKFAILKFKEFNSIDEITPYLKKSLYVERKNAISLQKDEYFYADLLQMHVKDDTDTFHGVLVEIMKTGANDVYVVKTDDNKEFLIPAIKDCIRNVDLENGIITIHLLDGLLDI